MHNISFTIRWVSSSIGLLFVAAFACAQWTDESNALFQSGNQATVREDFEQAIDYYQQAAEQVTSSSIFHNLGVAHYKLNDVGKSVYYLEHAKLLDFWGTDTQNVLNYIREEQQLRYLDLRLLERLGGAIPKLYWAVLFTITFWAALFMWIYLYLLGNRKAVYRDVASIITAVFLFAGVAYYGARQLEDIGVLIPNETPLHVAPSSDSEVFISLRGGELSRLVKSFNEYIFIETPEGIRGWVAQEHFWLIKR